MKAWRLLDTGAMSASLNMAVDEALLETYAQGESLPTLRFYGWIPPAVSLGYFQRQQAVDLASCRRAGLDVVRRRTGGRAVLHLEDLTYSIVAGPRDGIPWSLAGAYRLLCTGLLSGFRQLGFEAEVGRESACPSPGDICFLSSGVGDIVFQGKKFLGNAQTWSGSSMLQHGSITLQPQRETWATILATESLSRETYREKLRSGTTSIEEIAGRRVEADEVKRAIEKGMARALGADFHAGELSREEWALAAEKCAGRELGGKACKAAEPLWLNAAGLR